MTSYDCTAHIPQGNIRLTESCGTGTAVVLLHGSGYGRKVFERQFASPLAEKHHLIAIDLPGHGESQDGITLEDYLLPNMAQAIDSVLEARNVDRAVIYGWSLGGHVAMELMAQSDRLMGLMLSGAPPLPRGPMGILRGFQARPELLLATKEHFNAKDAERFFEMCFHGAGDPAFFDLVKRADGRVRAGIGRSLMLGIGADALQTVQNAEIPVAMVNGQNETVIRLSYLTGIDYGSLWGNVCHIVPRAGHAVFWDQPDIFNRLLTQFVADCADIAANPTLRRDADAETAAPLAKSA